MRRPRTKLEVSTFPFLAVLLCAMGALLLLLFIMDRRAKIAAQHQVSEMKAKRQTRSKEEDDAREAEWEAAKEKLRRMLLVQHEQVLESAKGIQGNLIETDRKLQIARARHAELSRTVQAETAKIGAIEVQIAGQRSTFLAAEVKDKASKAELLRASKELAELEFTIEQLRALRERDKQVYSVVPYRGKRGEVRPPIYVECVAGGVLFHNETKRLGGLDFNAAALRIEVERRTGPLAVEKPTKDRLRPADDRKVPYVLFLVRPDGIESYYKASAALAGYQLDFGYELIDQDWTLDFAGDSPAPAPAMPIPRPKDLPKVGFPGIGGTGPAGASPSGGGGGTSEPIRPRLGPAFPVPAGNGPPATGTIAAPYGTPAFVPTGKGAPLPIATTGTPKGARDPEDLNPLRTPIPGNSMHGPKPNGGTTTEKPPAESKGASMPSFGLDQGKKRPIGAPPARLPGDRDFVITIDCYADRVTVFPGGTQFRWPTASKATDDAFVNAVANLIAKRQASARPGDPPYRPVIRFQVSREGLHSYFHAYPLLEPLRVPMTRENVEDH